MTTCASCNLGFNPYNKITCCISCRLFFHASESCAQLTASEIKVIDMKKTPLMVYRCAACTDKGRADCIPDLIDTMDSISHDVKQLNVKIEDLKSIKMQVEVNKSDITELKIMADKVEPLIDRIATIENNVEEMRVRVNDANNSTNIPLDVSSIAIEVQERVNRSSHIIFYGITESVGRDKDNHDFEFVRGILQKINGIDTSIITLRRLGKSASNHSGNVNRPLLVNMGSANEVNTVIAYRNTLPQGISVSKDRTVMEREQYKQLKAQVQEHNNNKPDDLKKVVYYRNVPTIVSAVNKKSLSKNLIVTSRRVDF